MLTQHRDEARLEILREAPVLGALVIALESEPVHLAAARDVEAGAMLRVYDAVLPRRADRRNVVLRVAGRDARGASGAAREVDGHRPAPLGHLRGMLWVVQTLEHALIGRGR